MLAVLTGDIVNSRQAEPAEWLPVLKALLDQYGQEPISWEIFRGDSFQLLVDPQLALRAAIHLKAGIRQIKKLDVRIGIGIGEEEFSAAKISESNGSAYIRSGESFESLQKQNIAVNSGTDFDEVINLMLALALLNMDSWSATVAGAIRTTLENPDKSQSQIAVLMKKSQSSISEALTRGGFEEVMQMINFFKNQMRKL